MAVKIISYTDTTVIGIRLGPSAVAIYVLPLQLIEYGRIVVSGLSSVLLPELAASQARGSQTVLRSAYLQASRVSCVLAVFLNVNVIYLGVPFLRIWIGDAYAVEAFPILLCLGIASIAQALSTQLSLPFHQATDTVGFPVAVLLLEAAINLALSLWLVGLLGIRGVALATLVPAVGVTFVLLPPYTCRLLRVSVSEWLRHTLPAGVALLLALVVLHTLMNFAFSSATYAVLVVKMALAGALTALIAKRMVPMTPRPWPAQVNAVSAI
jgi:O-antigen/teichoic acid export membrane protein